MMNNGINPASLNEISYLLKKNQIQEYLNKDYVV